MNPVEGFEKHLKELEEQGNIFDEDTRKCRICGCTQYNACDGGCYWITDDLCSQCMQSTNSYSVVIAIDTESERYVKLIDHEKLEVTSLEELPLEMQMLTFSEANELKGKVEKLINETVEIVYVERVLILED